MGTGGELWDDSALVDAFDHAMATYKAMHGKNTQATLSEKEKAENNEAAVEEPISTETADEHIEKEDNCNDLPSDAMETPLLQCEERATEQVRLQETDLEKEPHVSESQMHSSGVADADRSVCSLNQQTVEYNELLRRYYELEEQSQQVLQQLHQPCYWNYETPGQSSTYQQQLIPAYSATVPDPHSSSAQCSCCCFTVPLVSVSCSANSQSCGGSACEPLTKGCSISLTCDQCPSKSTTCPTGAGFMQLPTKESSNDDRATKAAMMAAEGAVNFMTSSMSGDPSSFQSKEAEIGKKESTNSNGNQSFEATGTDTDLAVVLNAWYAAGFYTGRYLMQQSMKNSR